MFLTVQHIFMKMWSHHPCDRCYYAVLLCLRNIKIWMAGWFSFILLYFLVRQEV